LVRVTDGSQRRRVRVQIRRARSFKAIFRLTRPTDEV
jgi:hypothetical protein